jgi:hypothetical protein
MVVPGQHLNSYESHEAVVVVVEAGLVVVPTVVETAQLVPSLFLFFVLVPGQHPN